MTEALRRGVSPSIIQKATGDFVTLVIESQSNTSRSVPDDDSGRVLSTAHASPGMFVPAQDKVLELISPRASILVRSSAISLRLPSLGVERSPFPSTRGPFEQVVT